MGITHFMTVFCMHLLPQLLCNQHRHNSEDEEDVFSKTTELQSPHTSISIDSELASTTTTTTNMAANDANQTMQTARKHTKDEWEHFSDNEDEDDERPPRELFTESQINNNVTYSFDNMDDNASSANNTNFRTPPYPQQVPDTNIFLPSASNQTNTYAYLWNLSFYKTCLLHVAIKYGAFVYYTLFPSYLYFNVSFLHRESITRILGVIFIGVLVEAMFIGFWKVSRAQRALPIAVLLWVSAIGNFLISDTGRELAFAMGAILITTSTFALEYVARSVIVNSGKSRGEYAVFKVISGMSLLLFFVINPSYSNCFRLVGLLQFSTGSIWFCNFVYKKMLRVY